MPDLCLQDVQSIVCLGAHSDDIEIGCGGTILEWIAANPELRIHWVVFSGDAGRQAEAEASAANFFEKTENGTIEFFDYRDSFFPDQWGDIKASVASVAARHQADLVFTHRLEDRHQDHRVIAELTWCVFRSQLIFEYEIPKYEGDLGQPNSFLPLSTAVVDQKVDLLMNGFPSQRDKPWFDADLFRSMMRLRGSECHSPTRFAEAFHCRKSTLKISPNR